MNIQQDIPLPVEGKPVSQDWGKRVTDAVNSGRVGGGVGTTTESSKLGTYVSHKGRRKPTDDLQVFTSGVVPCKTTGGNAADGFTVEIYGNGKVAAKTGVGTLYITEINAGAEVKVGSWFLGFAGVSVITGGG